MGCAIPTGSAPCGAAEVSWLPEPHGRLPQVRRRPLLALVIVLAGLLLPGAPLALGRAGVPVRGQAANPSPSPSGAERAYPLNHTFEGNSATIANPAAADFEQAGGSAGTPPTNADFASLPTPAGVPANHDCETGMFSGWTTTGSLVLLTDVTRGYHAKIVNGSTLTTDAFTVGTDAQAVVFDLGFRTGGDSGVRLFILTGPAYSTSTQLAAPYCGTAACQGAWAEQTANLSGYGSQSVKLRLERYFGDALVDNVRAAVPLPGWEVSGNYARGTEADGNVFAILSSGSGNTITSSAFSVDAAAQYLTLRNQGHGRRAPVPGDRAVGAGSTTATDVIAATHAQSTWETVRANVTPWAGQTIKLRVLRMNNGIHIDDAGAGWVETPGWSPSTSVDRVSAGAGGTGSAAQVTPTPCPVRATCTPGQTGTTATPTVPAISTAATTATATLPNARAAPVRRWSVPP